MYTKSVPKILRQLSCGVLKVVGFQQNVQNTATQAVEIVNVATINTGTKKNYRNIQVDVLESTHHGR